MYKMFENITKNKLMLFISKKKKKRNLICTMRLRHITFIDKKIYITFFLLVTKKNIFFVYIDLTCFFII